MESSRSGPRLLRRDVQPLSDNPELKNCSKAWPVCVLLNERLVGMPGNLAYSLLRGSWRIVMGKVARQTVDLSAFPDLVVIYHLSLAPIFENIAIESVI
jgi:hypothetical protein